MDLPICWVNLGSLSSRCQDEVNVQRFLQGKHLCEKNEKEPGRDGEPSDHNGTLTLSEGDKEGSLDGNVQDCHAVQGSFSKAAGESLSQSQVPCLKGVPCLPGVPSCAQLLAGSNLWET